MPNPAGKHTLAGGVLINAAKLDNVEEVIKVDKPSEPIYDYQTTYNQRHRKDGYPYHYPPAEPKPIEPKIDYHYERFPGAKKHPFEVKSTFESNH